MIFSENNPFYIEEGAGKGKYWLVKIPGGFFPDAIYNGTSEGQIRAKLRKNLKKPELVKSAVIERVSPTAARKWYRAHAKDLEGIDERNIAKMKSDLMLAERKLVKMAEKEQVLAEAASDYHKWSDISKALTRTGKNAKWISSFKLRMAEVEKEGRIKAKGSGNSSQHQWEVINAALSLSGLSTRDTMKIIGFLPKGKVTGQIAWHKVLTVLTKELGWVESQLADFARFFPKYDGTGQYPKVGNSSSSGRNRSVRIDDVFFALKKFDKKIPIAKQTKIQKALDKASK